MKTIAIIPARGGSKGIPRKNMRLMNGKPLIGYAIGNALGSTAIDTVVVSTDSPEIQAYASQFDGVVVLDRKSELAADAVTLDPVIYDAVCRVEEEQGESYDTVITLQPTSPLLTRETLDAAIAAFGERGCDTMISVVNAPHLSWKDGEDGACVPAYQERLNRQELPAEYRETGAFLIAKRACVTVKSRIGENVSVFEVPDVEATDIDTVADWIVCEAMLRRKRIAFRVDGYKELGLGHVFRALTLAYELIGHDIVFICSSRHREGIEKLRGAFMKVVEVDDYNDLFDYLRENHVDVFVYDCLDSSADYIRSVKRYCDRVVTFEDLGDGAQEADAVVNALYEGDTHGNVFSGKNYICLRDEFMTSIPRAFNEEVKRVLVTFGGTDPLDLTSRVYRMVTAEDLPIPGVAFDFVLGPGYDNPLIVDVPERDIHVYKNLVRVSEVMRTADMALASQGRTTFELASLGVPTIVLAQNERELTHSFAHMDNGFINLGLGSETSDEDILEAMKWLIGASSIRREMRRLMLSNDFRKGMERVKRIVLGEML